MFRLAFMLEHGNPFLYLLFIMIFIPPVILFIISIIFIIKDKIRKRRLK